MIRRPPRSTLFPYTNALPIYQAWLIAAVCTVSSVAGGVLGYAIGYFLYDSLGQWLITIYGLQEGTEEFRRWYARSEEHTSELQSRQYLVCRLLLEKKKIYTVP